MHRGVSKVARLGLGGRHVADRFEQAAGVEPIDPFEGGELDSLEGSPWPTAMGADQRDWPAAGFTDTRFRCDCETGGAACGVASSGVSSKSRRFVWSANAG